MIYINGEFVKSDSNSYSNSSTPSNTTAGPRMLSAGDFNLNIGLAPPPATDHAEYLIWMGDDNLEYEASDSSQSFSSHSSESSSSSASSSSSSSSSPSSASSQSSPSSASSDSSSSGV